MVNMSKIQQPLRDEKCHFKATHWSSINDKVTLTPQSRVAAGPKQHHAMIQRNSCLYKRKLKLKPNKTYRGHLFLN